MEIKKRREYSNVYKFIIRVLIHTITDYIF